MEWWTVVAGAGYGVHVAVQHDEAVQALWTLFVNGKRKTLGRPEPAIVSLPASLPVSCQLVLLSYTHNRCWKSAALRDLDNLRSPSSYPGHTFRSRHHLLCVVHTMDAAEPEQTPFTAVTAHTSKLARVSMT